MMKSFQLPASDFEDRKDPPPPGDEEDEDDDEDTTLEPSSMPPDVIPTSPVTSVFIYEPTTAEGGEGDVLTRSILAGDGLLISTSPVYAEEGGAVGPSTMSSDYEYEGEDGTTAHHVPVTVVSQVLFYQIFSELENVRK